jgi:hypothetical protein
VPVGFAVSAEPSKFFPEREESSFDPDDDARTVIAGRMGALAGAFSQAVRGSAVTALEELNRPLDDWYVGINGVPVGPMRLGELRSKAAATAITLDSLVWRDGLGEWAPLRTFPELVAIVEESQSSARASLAPVPPGSDVAARLPGGSLSGAPGPIAIRHAGDAPDPFAATQFAQMPFPTPAAATSSVDVPEEVAGVPKRGSSNFAMWFAVVVAIAFGLTIGLVFAPEGAPRTEVKIVQVPASNTAVHGDIPAPPTSVAVVEETAPNKRPSSGGGARPAAAGAASVATTEGEGVKGLKGLAGLRAPGPNGPSADAGGGGGGQPLDSTAVQRTVSRYTGSVKRSCWQPALETRDRDAPSTARVSVSISVGPSGSVQSVSASGDPKGYRGLSNCIQARVRGWQFPASSGTTNINVPFVFAAQ